MGKIKNKILDISLISFADIFASGIAAIFWFYVAAIIGPEGYGQITYFISIALLASNIALLGAANTIVVYTAKKVKIQSTLYFLTLISGTIASIVIFLIFYSIGTSFLILGYIILGLITSELLGKKFYKTYSKFVITQRVIMVILAIGFYYLFNNEGIFIGMALSYSPYIIKIIEGFRENKINFLLVKERSNFMINSFVQTLTGSLTSSLDKLVIAPLFGLVLLGNYSLGLQFLTLLMLLPNAAFKYMIPQDSSGIENKKLKKMIIIFAVIAAVVGFTIGPMIISSIFPKFYEAEQVIRIVSWAIIPNSIGIVYYSKFLGQERNRNLTISSFIWISVQVVGIVILGNIFGVNGIAVSLVLGTTCAAAYATIVDRIEQSKIN